ncbi:hypothetical protein QYE76_002292 [Lolium multiflorum]|uniref:Uncharacterized protein n=1 Tax=Lolium multiflorum TaxID=4521 RepID=A0AAD8VY52_LOLMU|nr:hypothetical protein QYE76_002292 [Lolium multiflorum]
MSGHAKKLSDLGIVIPNQLGIHRVLQSLPPSYKNFVMNYNMQNMNKELPELFSMLKSAEVEIKKENQVLMVNKTTSFKKQGKPNKGNFKKGGKKVAAPPEKPKAGPKPETVCYYCQGKGHWKRNRTKYLADLKSGHVKKKGSSPLPPSRSLATDGAYLGRKNGVHALRSNSASGGSKIDGGPATAVGAQRRPLAGRRVGRKEAAGGGQTGVGGGARRLPGGGITAAGNGRGDRRRLPYIVGGREPTP